MFGYVAVDKKGLSKEERARYQAAYCGLCHALADRCGSLGRAVLTYDMTFLTLLLSSLEAEEAPEAGRRRCPRCPLRGAEYACLPATGYCADMNIALAYYKCMDDWQDDGSAGARRRAGQLEAYMPGIRDKWPRQCDAIAQGIAALGDMEKRGEINPDLPANHFGQLMAQLFVWREGPHDPALMRMGAALGRFIYLMDALVDLRGDIRRQRYNPLVSQTDTDFVPVLTMILGESTEAFEALPIRRDAGILRNILYAGVWARFPAKLNKGGAS